MLCSLLLHVRVIPLMRERKRQASFHLVHPSSRKSATIQKCLLLRGGDTPEHGIAVREPAEAADDVGMLLGVFEGTFISCRPTQLKATLLVRKRFRMQVGEIEEELLRLGGLQIEPALNRAAGGGAGKRVGGERGGTAAEY